MQAGRLSRATCLDLDRVVPVLKALVAAAVIDCDGNVSEAPCTYQPDPVLRLEVERYLRAGDQGSARMQSSLGRFRGRLSRD